MVTAGAAIGTSDAWSRARHPDVICQRAAGDEAASSLRPAECSMTSSRRSTLRSRSPA